MTSAVLITINTSWNVVNFRGPLIAALKARGYEIISATPDDAYTPRLANLVDRAYALPMQNAGTSPIADALLFLRYLRLMRTLRPSVLLTYTVKPNIYGTLAARLLGIPVLCNVTGLGTAFLRGGALEWLVSTLYRAAFAGAQCVFFQNPEDRDLFLARGMVPQEKAILIPGSGIDLAYFSPRATPASDAVRFVLIARMLRDKGVIEFVEAARRIRALVPQVRFQLVGPTDVKNVSAIGQEELTAWVQEGIVEYLGETDDVRTPMAAADCVVLPSYREGLSRVLLEAAAMGKPLIATDVPGCRQVVDHCVNGLLCRPRDAEDLAATMQQFLRLSSDQRAAMGRESRAKAEREFDQARVIDAYVQRIAALSP